ncbi:MAG: hypothetical protein IKK75_07010 [Clostridia bacterium]|nr:hypothetical protein [Clostridia bacterium]
MKPAPLKQRLSGKALAWLCVAALLMSLLPLYTLSFYNHASYSDLGYAILTHDVWREGGGWGELIRAALESTAGSRQTMEGSYAASFLSLLQPALTGGRLYWVTTILLLSFFLLSLHFFLRQMLVRVLKADGPTYWMAFCSVAFVMIQFVPELSEAFFWFNGGVAYTLMWSFMVLRLGVWVRLSYARTRWGKLGLGTLMVLLTVIVGGAKYATLLLALLVETAMVVWAFWKKRSDRWFSLAVALLLAACCIFSAMAPGNQLRGAMLPADVSAPEALFQSVFLGIALMGNWFSLPLLVVWALVAWQLSEALHGSPFRFSHPVWITVLSLSLFCAQLIPAIIDGQYLSDGRMLNTCFYTFVLMGCVLVLYWMGWVMRQRERRTGFAAIGTAKKDGLRIAAFAVALVLLVVACVSFQPEDISRRGMGNMSAVSALRSLITGEAQAYDEAMRQRDAALNDPGQPEVVLEIIPEIPEAFMDDALEGENLDEILRLLTEYYEKQRVSMADGE